MLPLGGTDVVPVGTLLAPGESRFLQKEQAWALSLQPLSQALLPLRGRPTSPPEPQLMSPPDPGLSAANTLGSRKLFLFYSTQSWAPRYSNAGWTEAE